MATITTALRKTAPRKTILRKAAIVEMALSETANHEATVPPPQEFRTSNLIKREIIVGIIAAILVTIFFQPLIQWVWGLAITISSRTYSGILNGFYSQAALGINDHVAVEIEVFIFGIATGTLVSANSVLLLLQNKKPLTGPTSKTHEQPQKSIFTIFRKNQTLSRIKSIVPAILAPVISDQQYKELKASWALMKSRGDYDAISKELLALAAQTGTELPPPLLP